jgi:hypothetical protein
MLCLLGLAVGEEVEFVAGGVRERIVSKAIDIQTSGPPPEHPSPDLCESHPFGYRARAPLPWWYELRLESLRQKHGANVLMAAFQTALPDPILAEEYNFSLAADYLAGAVVMPGEVFSLNKHLGPRTVAKGYKEEPMYSGGRVVPAIGGGVCKIATTLYSVIVLCNLQIVERHPHSMQVPYVSPGQDATICYGSLDFRFRNTTQGPIVVWSDTVGNTLFIAVYGPSAPPKVTWHHQILSRQELWEVTRVNSSLPKGSRSLVMQGYEGPAVRIWLDIEHTDGRAERRDLGVDRYQALPTVVEVNP